jgi:hypothetical protein
VQISSRRHSELSTPVTTYTASGFHPGPVQRRDRVTISPEARELHAAFEREEDELARGDASDGDELDESQLADLARAYAYSLDRADLDRSEEIAGTGPARYRSTGQPVTRENELRFNLEAQDVRSRRIALYEAQLALRTHASDILDKLVTFMEGQSAEYRSMLDWSRLMGHMPRSSHSDLANDDEPLTPK